LLDAQSLAVGGLKVVGVASAASLAAGGGGMALGKWF